MPAYRHGAEYLCAGTDVHGASSVISALCSLPATDCYLLEKQTIWADLCIGMNHDAIWVRQQKAATEPAIQGDIGTCYNTPEMMSKNGYRSWQYQSHQALDAAWTW